MVWFKKLSAETSLNFVSLWDPRFLGKKYRFSNVPLGQMAPSIILSFLSNGTPIRKDATLSRFFSSNLVQLTLQTL